MARAQRSSPHTLPAFLRPGGFDECSAVFLVWFHEQSEDRSDVGTIDPERDLGELLDAVSTDVIMLKLAHYWSP